MKARSGKEPNPHRQKMAKQMQARAQRERQKKKDKLLKALRDKGENGGVNQADIDRSFLRDYLDSMGSFLPRRGVRSMPSVPPRPPSQWKSFPMRVPGRSDIEWMPADGMGDICGVSSPKNNRHIELPLARALVMKLLHKEILQFSDYVGLTANETAQREGVLGEVHDAIKAKYGTHVIVSAFGSYASGLSIFDSDLDVTVEGLGIAIDDKGKQVAPSPEAKLGLCVLTSAGSVGRTGALGDEETKGQEKEEIVEEEEKEEEVPFQIDRRGEVCEPTTTHSSDAVIDLSDSPLGTSSDKDQGHDDKKRKREQWNRERDNSVTDLTGDDAEEEAVTQAEEKFESVDGEQEGPSLVLANGVDITSLHNSLLPYLADSVSDSDDSDSFYGYDDREGSDGDGLDIMAAKGAVRGPVIATTASRNGSGVVHVRYEGDKKPGQRQGAADIDCGVLTSSSNSSENSAGSGSGTTTIETDLGGLRKAVVAASSSSSSSSGGGHSSTRSVRLTNGATIEVDQRYASNVGMLVPQAAKDTQRVKSELKARGTTTTYLSGLHGFLQQCGWVEASEFRSRAKVPIIALRHKSGIECDISLGVNAATHSEVVQDLVELVGRAVFIPLSRLLKVFLGSVGADKPFNGGIGSFKLYVMIAHIYTNVAGGDGTNSGTGKIARDDPDVGLAYLLRLFFTYFGTPRNLQKHTTIQVRGAVITFDTTNVASMRELFYVAGQALDGAISREAGSLCDSYSKRRRGVSGGAVAGSGYDFSGVIPVIINASSLRSRRMKVKNKGDGYFGFAPPSEPSSKGPKHTSSPQSQAQGQTSEALSQYIHEKKASQFSRLLLHLHRQVCQKRGLSHAETGNRAIDEVFAALEAGGHGDGEGGSEDAVRRVREAHATLAARVASYAFVNLATSNGAPAPSSGSGSGSGSGSKKRRLNGTGNGISNFKELISGTGKSSSSSSRKKVAARNDRYPGGVTGGKIKDFENLLFKKAKKARHNGR